MVDHPSDEQLAGYVLQTITDEEREYIDHHLQRCPTCRALLSGHEATVRRIRYELAADLRQASTPGRFSFANATPGIGRSRRWNSLKVYAGRGLAVGGQAAVWLVILAILALIVQGTLLPGPRPATSDLASDATFMDRDLRLYVGQPALSRGPKDAWDAWWVGAGPVTFHDGKFHMFYSGRPRARYTVSIGYATSTDGITWTRESSQPIFTPESAKWAEKLKHVSANSVLVDEGRWTLYFTASTLQSILSGAVGRATAPSPTGPWTVGAQAVLTPGAPGAWDAGLVGDACVVRDDDGYVMYYAGGILHKMIGRAVSDDGITWTKHNDPATTDAPFADSDPMLQIDQEWEAGSLEHPCVQWSGERWVMTYVSNNGKGIGYAVSADGIRWLKSPQNPIVLPDVLGKPQGLSSAGPFIHEQTAFLYFQLNLDDASHNGVYVATWREP